MQLISCQPSPMWFTSPEMNRFFSLFLKWLDFCLFISDWVIRSLHTARRTFRSNHCAVCHTQSGRQWYQMVESSSHRWQRVMMEPWLVLYFLWTDNWKYFETHCILFLELDGPQTLDFYWIDPIDAAQRFISKPKFSGKLYTQYKRQWSTQRPGKRAFGRANSGLVFQCCQAVDKYSSPLLLLFYADKSFSGKHRTHHPIYSKWCVASINTATIFK